MLDDLEVYRTLPVWSAETLPKTFQEKHNTKEGTWARMQVHSGSLRFTLLTEEGEERASSVITPTSEPLLIEPGAWHKVTPLGPDLSCQLSFLCEPLRYFEKKHQLTAPHSEVQALLPLLEASEGRAVLDLGCGRGRNSFFLATHGFNVTAVDRSPESIATLKSIQEAEGLSVSAREYDINTAALGELFEDGLEHIISTVVFQFLNPERVLAILEDMQRVTRSGGHHLIVAPINVEGMPCPLPFPFIFEQGALRDHYQGWEIIRYEESPGEFHKRDENGDRYQAHFVTMVARKP